MNDIEFGILLNFIFWIVTLPIIVTFVVWVCVVFFDSMDKPKENIRSGSGRDASPPGKETEDWYRKTA
ncbi:MAG TPA: hypothetical protein VLB08_05245 [Candidatus Deferrimicrobium sp.]|nr:hypothetical protein [Candidatus Deferrimicrobium sp.]